MKRGNWGEVGESVGQVQYAVVEALVGTKGAGLATKGVTAGTKALIGAERLAKIAANASKIMASIKSGKGLVKVGKKKIIKVVDDLVDPPGTKRNSLGQLYDEKTGRFVKDPKTKGKAKIPTYNRSMSERRQALLRDAHDTNRGLSNRARR